MKKAWLLALLLVVTPRLAVAQNEEPLAESVPIAEEVAEAVEASPEKTPTARPLTVVVELLSGSMISGTLVQTNQLEMKTSFGQAGIPLTEVAGIRLPSGDDVSTTVVMLNGDSITGATDLKEVLIETEWGSAKINGSAVSSMLFVPNVKWNSANNLSGKRWTLTDAAASPPPTRPAAAGQFQPPQPINSQPINSQQIFRGPAIRQ